MTASDRPNDSESTSKSTPAAFGMRGRLGCPLLGWFRAGGPGLECVASTTSRSTPSSYPTSVAPLPRLHKEGPGLTARGGRSASHFQWPAPQMLASIQWWRGGTPRETPSHPGGPPAGVPAPACSIAAVTLSDHQPGRGVTQSPGAGPGASSLSTRRGTPMPAGCPPGPLRTSRTRTWTGTPLPRGRRALPYFGLSSPRPTRTGPTAVTPIGARTSPSDQGVNSRKSTSPKTRTGAGRYPSVHIRPPGGIPGRTPSTSTSRALRDPS